MSGHKVRVRFAPSPTGPLHMGGVRTALYNYLFAKQHNGDFILRVEDTDQTRYVKNAEQYIIDSLKWCGITPDEGVSFGGDFGPYRQSERKDLYRQYVDKLIAEDKAYYAFDTSEDLETMRQKAKEAGSPNWQYNHVTRNSMRNSLTLSKQEVEKLLEEGHPHAIRIKLPRNEDIKVKDTVRGWVSVNTNNMDDKVLFKGDGMPTYHMANVVDDHLMKISHVIRGEEWLPSLPLHHILYQYLGWEAPEFAHLPLILKPDGKGKLSKRDGDRLGFPVFPLEWDNPEGENFPGFRERGYFPEAFVNMLAFLGWNPGTDQEVFEMDQLIRDFSLEKVNKAGAKYDHAKTKWFNQQFLRKHSNAQLGQKLQQYLKEHRSLEFNASFCEKVAELVSERAYFISDLYEEGKFLFEAIVDYDEKTKNKKWNEQARAHIAELRSRLSGLTDFSAEAVEKEFKGYLSEKELGFGKVGPAFRLALTGRGMGPSLFAISELLGKEETLKRLDNALNKLP